MKIKAWSIYKSGSYQIGTVLAPSAIEAAKQFMRDNYPGQGWAYSYPFDSKDYMSITLKGNYTIMSDFVIQVEQ